MTPDEQMPGSRPDRRSFVRTLIAGGALTTTTRISPAQDEPAKGREKEQEPAPPDPLQVEVDARLAILVARRGDALDEGAREMIRADIEGLVRRARRLRRIPLDNGDGPFPVMIPYRAPAE